MNTFVKDLRYAARMLLKNPAFSAIAIIALALGIGANTAIFSVVSAVLLRPLPFAQPEQIVAVWTADTKKPDSRTSFSFPDFADLRDQNQVFSATALYDSLEMTATDRGSEAAHLHGAMVTSDLFRVLGTNPVLGRPFTASDDKAGARVVIISHELWQRRFGGDRNVLQQTITLNESPYQIIGVMPPSFRFPIEKEPALYWTSAATMFEGPPDAPTETAASQRGMHFARVVARLKPGVTPQQAEANCSSVLAGLATQYPDTNKRFDSSRVTGLLADLTADVRPALMVLLAAAACVLLIACVNVANLLLARATSREKEMGIRSALGASRGRIFRQLLTESAMLSLIGGAAGMLLAIWGTEALAATLPQNFPRASEIHADVRVLAFTALVSLFTGVLFGFAPAWRVSRPDVVTVLNESARGSSETARGRRLRGILVTAEMVLAFVLLVGAGLLLRSFWQLQKVPLGFDAHNVITASISLPEGDYSPQVTARNEHFYAELTERARMLPGVRSLGAIFPLPLSGNDMRTGFDIQGRPTAKSDRPLSAVRVVTPGYFATMGIPLKKG
ncbi:MAG: ADOP family duplicated permease, partial [Chthoniobacterales bacterium]